MFQVRICRFVYSIVSLALVLGGCATGDQKTVSKPERARLWVDVGNASLLEGDPTGALEAFYKAKAEDDSLPELHYGIAMAFYFKRDLNQAMSEMQTSLKLKPDYSDANNAYGKFLIEKGDSKSAIPYLSKAIKDPLYRDAFKARTNLGIAYYKIGQYPDAESQLSEAIVTNPNNACVALYYRGHVRLRDSRFKEAIADYDKATRKLCARFGEAHVALGIAYIDSKKYDLARKKFLEVQDQYPGTKFAEQAMNYLRKLP